MTINTIAQRLYKQKLRAENIMTVRRPHLDLGNFQREYFAPGGIGERLGSEYFDRTYRTLEILGMTGHDSLPQMIDHHAGNAWYQIWNFARQGYAPHYQPADNRRALAEIVLHFPQVMRDRLDAVLEGLRLEIDPDGNYEREYFRWVDDWYRTMTGIYEATPRQYAKRLRLMRQAAEEAVPGLIELLERIRFEVCDGGHVHTWVQGDAIREGLDSLDELDH